MLSPAEVERTTEGRAGAGGARRGAGPDTRHTGSRQEEKPRGQCAGERAIWWTSFC